MQLWRLHRKCKLKSPLSLSLSLPSLAKISLKPAFIVTPTRNKAFIEVAESFIFYKSKYILFDSINFILTKIYYITDTYVYFYECNLENGT